MNVLCRAGCSVLAGFVFSTAGYDALAYGTVLPDFAGEQAEFSNYRTRITDAMLSGPNFANSFTVITIGCGTNCLFGYVGDNETGQLYHLPFGGEENSHIQLEFDLNSNIILVSYRYNPLVKISDSWQPKYEYDQSPCIARRLSFAKGEFIEEDAREVERFGRNCPPASELLQARASELSAFKGECSTEFTRLNLCEEARRVADGAKSILPIRVDQELTILSLASEGRKLRMTAKWDLSMVRMHSRMKANNVTIEELKAQLRQAGSDNACNDGALAAFIGLGGILEYTYLDSSYSSIHSFEIDSCDTPRRY